MSAPPRQGWNADKIDDPMTTSHDRVETQSPTLVTPSLETQPRQVTQKRPLFYTPPRQRRLSDWDFPCINDPHEALGSTYPDDNNVSIAFNSTLHESASTAWIDDIADGVILLKSRPPLPAPRRDAPRRRTTAVAHQRFVIIVDRPRDHHQQNLHPKCAQTPPSAQR